MHSTAVEVVKDYENVSKCSYCSGSHRLHICASFKRVPPPQRSVHVNQQRLCFNCLKASHNSKRCYSKPLCAVAGCGRKYHTLLHEHLQQVRRPVVNPTSTASENQAVETPTEHKPEVKCNGIKSSSLVYFNIVPVRVRCDVRELLVNAFQDQGSSATLCDQRLLEVLNVPSEDIFFGLTTVGCATQQMKGKKASLSVAPVVDGKFIDLPNVISVKALPMCRNPRLSPQDLDRWPHLRGVDLHTLDETEVWIINGVDVPNACWSLEERRGSPGEPCTVKTMLGWSRTCRGILWPNFNHIRVTDTALDQSVRRLWQLEQLPSLLDTKHRMSKEDR